MSYPTLTAEQLADLERLGKAATRGPYFIEVACDGSGDLMLNGTGSECGQEYDDYIGDIAMRKDADYILALLQHAPALVAWLKTLVPVQG